MFRTKRGGARLFAHATVSRSSLPSLRSSVANAVSQKASELASALMIAGRVVAVFSKAPLLDGDFSSFAAE